MALYEVSHYVAPIDYIISCFIREYDISKANINVLRKCGAISDEEYAMYFNMDRTSRQVSIGCMMKEKPEIVDILKRGITEARQAFFQSNDINDNDILSIKNDAIFVLNKNAYTTSFDGVDFVLKNVYTSYYKILSKEFYYFINVQSGVEKLDIKGISPDRLILHKEFFLDFLSAVFNTAQLNSVVDVLELIQNFYMSYVNRELPIGYYRRFDGMSLYDITEMSKYSDFKAYNLPQTSISDVDISYNLKILQELQKIFAGIYFQQKRHY